MANPQQVPIEDGCLVLFRDWIPPAEALALFSLLRDELAWEQSVIRIAGMQRRIPRLNAWYGDPGASYRYSGTDFDPLAWTVTLAQLRSRLAGELDLEFNSVLANLYRDGNDCVGWHSDDERELGPNPCIASVSLGSERRFVMKHKRDKSIARIELKLPSGSLLVMSGATQHHWIHQLPRTRVPVGPRINLTFRRIVTCTS